MKILKVLCTRNRKKQVGGGSLPPSLARLEETGPRGLDHRSVHGTSCCCPEAHGLRVSSVSSTSSSTSRFVGSEELDHMICLDTSALKRMTCPRSPPLDHRTSHLKSWPRLAQAIHAQTLFFQSSLILKKKPSPCRVQLLICFGLCFALRKHSGPAGVAQWVERHPMD